jgi:hypothetical protein
MLCTGGSGTVGIATVGGTGAAGGSGAGGVGTTTAGTAGSAGATTMGRAGATGGAGGKIIGGVSCAPFVGLFEIEFSGTTHAALLFHVQIHPWVVVATAPGSVLSVVLPHVQFHVQIQVVGSATAPCPAVAATATDAGGAGATLGA